MLSRPTHSPDFAPVEWCFGEMDSFLRAREGTLTPETFMKSVGDAAASISVDHIRSYFQAAHYFVPGLDHKMYVDGSQ